MVMGVSGAALQSQPVLPLLSRRRIAGGWAWLALVQLASQCVGCVDRATAPVDSHPPLSLARRQATQWRV